MESATDKKVQAVKDSSNQMKIKVTEMEIGTEFKRLMEIGDYYPLKKKRFDFGNGYLYLFCQEHPLPETIIAPDLEDSDCASDSDILTEQEAAFADQLWLIGRSYAASPERYRYSPGTKPKDSWLDDTEGYESFFGDITRILFRGKCHNPNRPLAYLRGKLININGSFNNLNNYKTLQNAYYEITSFGSFLKEVNYLKNSRYKLFKVSHPVDLTKDTIKIYLEDIKSTKNISRLVIQFAQLLNAARIIRDAAIVHCCLSSTPSEDLKKCRDTFKNSIPSLSVSFCSKFLHFHIPQMFFIYDSISSDNIDNDNNIDLELKSEHISVSINPASNKDSALKAYVKSEKKDLISKLNSSTRKRNPKAKEVDSVIQKYITKCGSRYADYLIHATKELALAYVVFNYLLEQKAGAEKDLYNQIIASLKRGTCSQDSGSSIPKPPYYSITRMIDVLVSNSKKG